VVSTGRIQRQAVTVHGSSSTTDRRLGTSAIAAAETGPGSGLRSRGSLGLRPRADSEGAPMLGATALARALRRAAAPELVVEI
jgi:hypothetical protein